MEKSFDVENPLNLNEINFKIAFAFTGSDMLFGDPKYVKSDVSLTGQDSND